MAIMCINAYGPLSAVNVSILSLLATGAAAPFVMLKATSHRLVDLS